MVADQQTFILVTFVIHFMEELISGVSDQDVLILVNLEDFDSLLTYGLEDLWKSIQ